MLRRGSIPISLLVLALSVVVLPVLVFVIGQREGSQSLPTNANTPVFPLPSSTPSSTSLITADTYVDADTPNQNYGRVPYLWVDGSSVKIAYLKFDLTSLAGKNVSSAILRLKVLRPSAGPQTVKAVADTSWSESTVNYNNSPVTNDILGSIKNTSLGGQVDVDLTPYINSNKGHLAAVAITSSNPSGLEITSRENLINPPQLLVKTP